MRLDAATQGQLRLANAEGSVWNGRGLVTNAQRTWSLPIAWKVAPLEIARGNFAITLRDAINGGDSRGNFAWRDDILTADGVALAVPSAAVGGAMAAGNAVALGGTMALDAAHFSWGRNAGDGAATVRWNGARAASDAGVISLGTITVKRRATRRARPGSRREPRRRRARRRPIHVERRGHRGQRDTVATAVDTTRRGSRASRAWNTGCVRRGARAMAQRAALT
jgi:hypothetical protein